MYTLDTNAIIYHLQGENILLEVMKDDEAFFISSITELELLSFADLSVRDRKAINGLLKTCNIVRVDSQIARMAAFIRSKNKIKTPESIIAATAIFTDTVLLTRNIKDFKNIALLQIQKI